MDLHPRKLSKAPHLICIGESLSWFFSGCFSRAPWHLPRNPTGKVCWEWPSGFPFHHAILFKLVLQKILASTGVIMSAFTFPHKALLSCDVLGTPSRWSIYFSLYYCIINSLGFCNWTLNILYLASKLKVQMWANYSENKQTKKKSKQ